MNIKIYHIIIKLTQPTSVQFIGNAFLSGKILTELQSSTFPTSRLIKKKKILSENICMNITSTYFIYIYIYFPFLHINSDSGKHEIKKKTKIVLCSLHPSTRSLVHIANRWVFKLDISISPKKKIGYQHLMFKHI